MPDLPAFWRFREASTYAVAAFFYGAASFTAPRAEELDTLLFGSLDAAAATFVTAGAKIGLTSLDHDGAVALASLGGGRQSEHSSDGTHHRYTAIGAVVLGYQWFFDWGVIAAFTGPDITAQMLAGRQSAGSAPIHLGFRLHGEIWARPTETTLLQATVIAGTALESVWARAAWGYRCWGAYLGPELSLYTDATGYRKWNVGLHGTDFDLGRYSFRVSAGLQTETGRRTAGPYVALSVWSPW
ncbi:Cellulose biosynthesis protein BcsS [Methylobacterium phyllostachyos]|uniref:Cellulose biosynthesis protein BcsS n=1 Tax=Methylobacterium phyllostachyos TaxID=582672 RepID=A0A1G9YZ42_9HYPH|nr:cellulose biosynthesis protein BcsS [Methylobacterium phyllostachyos]SDN14449.1 Cellulose biosynthesis protein BcsS [Methylobacterium phyllostachyos]